MATTASETRAENFMVCRECGGEGVVWVVRSEARVRWEERRSFKGVEEVEWMWRWG